MAVTEARAAAEESGTDAPARVLGPRMSTVATAGFAVAGLSLGIRRLHDNSFMWHVRTGHYILDHGIPRHDPFSYTAPGAKWVAQSWLAELLYGSLQRAWGPFGIRIFGAVLGILVGGALFHVTWRLTGDRIRAIGLAGLAFVVMVQVWSERPLMLGLASMLALVALVELPESRLGRRPMLALPVLMWLWANVHGTFALGFFYLALHLVGRALEGAPPTRGRERQLLRASVLAGVLILANPYGIDLVLFPLRLLGRGDVLNGVEEWQSPNFRDLGGYLFGAWIVVMVVIFARKHVGRRDLLVSLAFLVLGLWAVRNVGLAVVVALPVLARAVRRDPAVVDERRHFNRYVIALLVLTSALGVVRATREPNWDFKRYPAKAYAELRRQHLIGARLFTTDGWGGYVIGVAWPDQKVFFDDRYDMYPLDIQHSYGVISGLFPGWDSELDKYKVEVIMWPKNSPLSQGLTQSKAWTKTYTDDKAVIFVRSKLLTK
jgi:hypothetical protein